MTKLTEKLKELLMGCENRTGSYYFNGGDADLIAQQLAPEIEKMIPRWIPVRERLPDDGQEADVFGGGVRLPDVTFTKGKWIYFSGYHDDGGMVEVPITVTHWAPIAKGPTK